MKFNIFSFQEKHYKKIGLVCTLLFTYIGIYTYLHSLKIQATNNNLISFVVSIVYALVLFILGLYLSVQSTRVENRFLVVKDYYISLCRLQELFSGKILAKDSYYDIHSFVSFHQLFTARTENNDKPIIKGDFFRYKTNYLKGEEKFLSTYSELLNQINKSVGDYIEQNSISKRVPYPHVHKIEDFIYNHKYWIERHLNLTGHQIQSFNDFQEQFLKDKKYLIKKIKKETTFLILKNQKIGKKIKSYRNRIEAVYGYKLHREIERDDLIKNSLYDINSLLKKIISQTSSFNSDDIGMVSKLKEEISELSILIANQGSSLETIIDIISDRTEF